MTFRKMEELDLTDQRVLIRQDLNVPVKDGVVTSDARIQAALPTLRKALDAGAKVMVMSHLGRPTEGEYDEKYSLAPVAARLSELLNRPVPLIKDWVDGDAGAAAIAAGEIALLENVRFLSGEKKDDPLLAKKMAALCDIYVMDAFGTAHRAQASTHGIGLQAPVACAGPLLTAELKALSQALDKPVRPLVAIVGGAKVSTKLTVLESLTGVVDQLIVGGGIANTFIAAAGFSVGQSLIENDLIPEAKRLLDAARKRGAEIPIPQDVVCAKAFSATATATLKPVNRVADDDMILDIGPQASAHLVEQLKRAGTIVWNGPVGVFEFEAFENGTKTLAHAIADSRAFSIAGGGDTLAAVDKYGINDQISYISTGGGAFLEFLEGKQLPAVVMLERRASA